MQLTIGDADVAGSGEQLMQQGSPFLIGTGVVRSQQRQEIALGLIGNHLDDVGQMLTLGGELDHGALGEVADFDPLGKIAALLKELRHARAVRSCLPIVPWAILKPRMVGRRCSALSAAAAPYSRSSLASSARAARISLSKARRSGWDALREIAARNRVTLSDLVGSIDSQRQHGNLSSTVRLFVLNHYRRRDEAEHPGAWPANGETQPGRGPD